MRVTHWPPDVVEARWPEIAVLVSAAMDHATLGFSLLDMYELLVNGFYQLEVIEDERGIAAVIAYRVRMKTHGRLLSMELCSGRDMERWMPSYFEHLLDIARKNGCKGLELVGRMGWSRALSRILPGRVSVQSVICVAEVPDAQ